MIQEQGSVKSYRNIEMIAILTPVFNRKSEIINLYKSLVNQSNQNFTWYIVDDGSTDMLEDIVSKMQEENIVKIHFMKQANSGKHIALNLGISLIREELTFIVDSDDCLTNDAINVIYTDWQKYKCQNICGISYLRMNKSMDIIGSEFTKDYKISTFVTERINNEISGDKAEVFKTSILKQFPFPSFKNEKFIGEACVWIQISREYKMLFRNYPIYICEYLKGGLTKSGRKLRILCPCGGMYHANEYLKNDICLKYRVKNSILFNCYFYFSNKKKEQYQFDTRQSLLLLATKLPGLLLFKIWKYKYY